MQSENKMADCALGCRQEFKKSNFGLNFPNPQLFVTSQWPCSPLLYVLYRVVIAAGFITMTILSGLKYPDVDPEPLRWFIYFSNWSFLLLTVDTVYQAATAIAGYVRHRRTPEQGWEILFESMPVYLRVQWVLTNVAACASFLVSTIYWGFIDTTGLTIDYNTYTVHVGNVVYVIVNLFITATPVRVYHVLHTWLYFLAYSVFGVIYELIREETVYGIISWREEPAAATGLTLLVGIVLSTTTWLVYYGLYRLRLILTCTRDAKEAPTGTDNPAFTPAAPTHEIQYGQMSANGARVNRLGGYPASQTIQPPPGDDLGAYPGTGSETYPVSGPENYQDTGTVPARASSGQHVSSVYVNYY